MAPTNPLRRPDFVERVAYSPEEVAQALGVTRQHVYNLMARGELRSVKLGRCRRIPADALAALLTSDGSDATPA